MGRKVSFRRLRLLCQMFSLHKGFNHVKKFNLQRHYTFNHADENEKYAEERMEVFSALKNNTSLGVRFGCILMFLLF